MGSLEHILCIHSNHSFCDVVPGKICQGWKNILQWYHKEHSVCIRNIFQWRYAIFCHNLEYILLSRWDFFALSFETCSEWTSWSAKVLYIKRILTKKTSLFNEVQNFCKQKKFFVKENKFVKKAKSVFVASYVEPASKPNRLVTGSWWLFCTIVMATYTGSLVAFLTVENYNIPFNNLVELLNQTEYKFGTLGGTSFELDFKVSIPLVSLLLWIFAHL